MSIKIAGRPRTYKTKKEAAAAAVSYQKDYLKVRKKRYHEDAAYRQKLIERDRANYREANPDFQPKDFGSKAGRAAKASKTFPGFLTIGEMAEFVGVVPKVLSGWIQNGKFPRPAKTPKGSIQRVYTIAQADALALVMKNGLKGRAAFRATDTDIIMRLAATMQKTK